MRIFLLWITGIFCVRVFADNVTVLVKSNRIEKIVTNDPEIGSTRKGKTVINPEKKKYGLKERRTGEEPGVPGGAGKSASEECVVARAGGPVTETQRRAVESGCRGAGCDLVYFYSRIFNGFYICGNSENFQEVAGRAGVAIKEIEKNGEYHQMYRQEGLPENFYTIMNGSKKTFGAPYLDGFFNRWVLNGYFLKRSALFRWYRNRYLTISTMRTGKGVTIFLVDGAMKKVHGEVEGRVALVGSEDATDDGHATSVITSAGGRTTGLAKESKFVLYPVFQAGVAYLGEILRALDQLEKMVERKKSVLVLPFSGNPSAIFDAALGRLHKQGVFVVAAAGNAGKSACSFSPGRSEFAITVGSVSEDLEPEKWSNTGPCVNAFAPGAATVGADGEGYTDREGSSISAGYVAGYIAQLVEGGDYTVEEVRNLLYSKKAYGVPHPPQEPSSYPLIRGSFSSFSVFYDALFVAFLIAILSVIAAFFLFRKDKQNFITYKEKPKQKK